MITRFWHWLFGGCEHKWMIFKEGAITRVKDDTEIGNHYEFKCEKCGRIRYQNTWIMGGGS